MSELSHVERIKRESRLLRGTLVEIVATHGGLERDAAEAYLRRLADERRYLRDVY